MRYFHYSDGEGVIRIRHSRKPPQNQPWSGTWVVRELSKELKWEMPPFPEITWGTLSKMVYLGSVPLEENGK